MGNVYFGGPSKMVFTTTRSVASVGWTISQNTWLLLLEQYVEIGIQGISAFSFPSPQQAALTSANPEKQTKILTYVKPIRQLITQSRQFLRRTISSWFLDDVLQDAVSIKVGVIYAFKF